MKHFSIVFLVLISITAVKAKEIAFFAPPFRGHINRHLDLAKDYIKKGDQVTFYLSSYKDHPLNLQAKKDIALIGAKLAPLSDHFPDMPKKAPAFRVPIKAKALYLPAYENMKKNQPDLIITDVLALEGRLLGKKFKIHTISLIPQFLGPSKYDVTKEVAEDRDVMEAFHYLAENTPFELSEDFSIALSLYLTPGDEYYILSNEKLQETIDFRANRVLNGAKITFIGPRASSIEEPTQETKALEEDLKHQKEKNNKKIIYVSFGTMVSGPLYNRVNEGKEFVDRIMGHLIESATKNSNNYYVFSLGKTQFKHFEGKPIANNVALFPQVDQLMVLKYADLFITHGGANSVNEAITANVPMIVIPFFDDQHFTAMAVKKAQYGTSFEHKEEDLPRAMNLLSGFYERESLNNLEDLEKAIKDQLRQ